MGFLYLKYNVETLCTIILCQNYIPLSSLLDSVFRSKMKSRAELKIMLEFFLIFALMLLFHSLFVILSSSSFFLCSPQFSSFFLGWKKNLQQKEQFFESCVAAMRSFLWSVFFHQRSFSFHYFLYCVWA